MSNIEKSDLKINDELYKFINEEVIPGTEINPENFWDGFSKVVNELTPINQELIKKREVIQKKMDEWHKNNKDKKFDKKVYTDFLKSVSYIVEEGEILILILQTWTMKSPPLRDHNL